MSSSSDTNSRSSFSYVSARQRAPAVRRFWLAQERDSQQQQQQPTTQLPSSYHRHYAHNTSIAAAVRAMPATALAQRSHVQLAAALLESGRHSAHCHVIIRRLLSSSHTNLNTLLAPLMRMAARRGCDLIVAGSLASRELESALRAADSDAMRVDERLLSGALGTLMRSNSAATKAVRAVLQRRCSAWLRAFVLPALPSEAEPPLECDPTRAESASAAARDVARLQTMVQRVLSAVCLSGSAALPDELCRLAARVRRCVHDTLVENVVRASVRHARMSRRDAFEARSKPRTRARRSSSAPRLRVKKLSSRRVVVRGEVTRLRDQIVAGDTSEQTAAALDRKQLELSDIDLEVESIADDPSAYLRASHFQRADGRAYHTAMVGFFFLRFVCPAVLTPQVYSGAPPSPTRHRNLLLLTKALQTLVNGVEFGRKQPHLAQLDRMHARNREPLRRFFVHMADRGERHGTSTASKNGGGGGGNVAQPRNQYQTFDVHSGRFNAAPLATASDGRVGDADDIEDFAVIIGALRKLLQGELSDEERSQNCWQQVGELLGFVTSESGWKSNDGDDDGDDAKGHYVHLNENNANVDASDENARKRASSNAQKLERIRQLLNEQVSAVRAELQRVRELTLEFQSVQDALAHRAVLAKLVSLRQVVDTIVVSGALQQRNAAAAAANGSAGESKLKQIVKKMQAAIVYIDVRMQELQLRLAQKSMLSRRNAIEIGAKLKQINKIL